MAEPSARPAVHPCGFSSQLTNAKRIEYMSQPPPEIEVSDMPLPETQRELELLLEALHALNSALDHYETEALAPA
jgi:hypothetical protein